MSPASKETSRAGLSADEQAVVEGVNTFLGEGSGYFRAQATRPQTIGFGLADSPAGQLAWLYDKFHDWTDSHGDPENVLTKDEILDDVMLYWLPGTAASSARFYWENRDVTLNMGPVEKIPVACSIFPHEIYRAPPRSAPLGGADLQTADLLERARGWRSFRRARAALDLRE
jgi:epoxide hydrolase